jgi:hypothetical protein
MRIVGDAYSSFAAMLSSETKATGAPETPIGSAAPDRKRYLEFDATSQRDVPRELGALRDALCGLIEAEAETLQRALLPVGGRRLADLLDHERGPLLRLTEYPAGERGEVNQAHTDIDLFTLLPVATTAGLEVLFDDGWRRVTPDPCEVLVLRGDILARFGGIAGETHRVVSDGDVRMSASLFANADPELLAGTGERVGDVVEERLRQVRRAGADGLDG